MAFTGTMKFFVSLMGAAVVSSIDLSCILLRRNLGDDTWMRMHEKRMGQPRSRLHCVLNCVRDERCRGINFRTSECNITDQTSPTSGQRGRVRYYRLRCKLGTPAITVTPPSARTSSHLKLTPMPTIGSHGQAATMLVSNQFKSGSPIIPESHLPKHSSHRNLQYSDKATESQCAFYNITVYTGTDRGAGTDAVVQLHLLGDQGRLKRELENDYGDDFESGSEDIFEFGGVCIGELLNLTVKVLAEGISPSWQLDRIRVEISPNIDGVPVNTTTYTADVNSWMSSNWNSKPDERTFPFLKLQTST